MGKNSKKIYVVVAYRWGDNSNHSYTLGAFNKKHAAIECAKSHTEYRGGKYACVVEQCTINEFDDRSTNYTCEIFRAKVDY